MFCVEILKKDISADCEMLILICIQAPLQISFPIYFPFKLKLYILLYFEHTVSIRFCNKNKHIHSLLHLFQSKYFLCFCFFNWTILLCFFRHLSIQLFLLLKFNYCYTFLCGLQNYLLFSFVHCCILLLCNCIAINAQVLCYTFYYNTIRSSNYLPLFKFHLKRLWNALYTLF